MKPGMQDDVSNTDTASTPFFQGGEQHIGQGRTWIWVESKLYQSAMWQGSYFAKA